MAPNKLKDIFYQLEPYIILFFYFQPVGKVKVRKVSFRRRSDDGHLFRWSGEGLKSQKFSDKSFTLFDSVLVSLIFTNHS